MKHKWIRVSSQTVNDDTARKRRIRASEIPQFEDEYGIKVFAFIQTEDQKYSFTDENSGLRITQKDTLQEGIDFLEDKFYYHNLAEKIKKATKNLTPLMELKNWSEKIA